MTDAVEPAAGTEAADREAVARLRDADRREAALTELFRRHGPVTFAFFARRTGNRETAAELNQELWMNVVRAHASFRGEASFRTWLFRMAHNQLSNLRRRFRTHLDERPVEPPEGFWDALRDDAEEPGSRLDTARRASALTRCLAALPETERAVVLGHYFENATLAALTERLGLANASGARAVLLAAQRRLRRCLSGAPGEAS